MLYNLCSIQNLNMIVKRYRNYSTIVETRPEPDECPTSKDRKDISARLEDLPIELCYREDINFDSNENSRLVTFPTITACHHSHHSLRT